MTARYFPFVRPLCLALCSAALTLARGAPLERDLGHGLTYDRVANVPADLPSTPAAPRHSQVLDLRYAQAGAKAEEMLSGWLKSHASLRTPVFILANRGTDPALLALLGRHDPADGVLTIGAPATGFVPDLAVKISPDTERRAYDALAARTDTDSLLRENPSKVRNDEARLAREHLPDAGVDDAVPEDEPVPEEKAPAIQAPPPLIDLALQRAVHVYRALLALKKI